MPVLMIFLCTVTSTVQNVFRKQFSLRCQGGDYFFSTMVSFFALLFFLLTADRISFSNEILPYSVGFAAVYALATVCLGLAIKTGSLAITSLIISYSLIIPTLYGFVFLNEKTTILKCGGILLLLISLFLVRAKAQGEEKSAKPTKTETAVSAPVQLAEEFTSEIEPYKQNDITPAASGVHIDRILVEVGDPVRQGQLIVTLDPTQYTQQLVQLKTVEDDYNRLLPVYEAGGISAQQIEQAKAQLDVQREVVANLKKNIEVHSPITGVVTARNYESGDLFAAQPILHIMQIDPLKVVANISEQYFRNVKVGMPVDLKVDIFPGETFPGTVSLIYPALDPATRTFKVEVKVPNAKRTLRPGMFARTGFNMGEKEG